jgi:hypothetical protein
MSDMREKQPLERVFKPMPCANYEIELKAWPYSGIQSENVISRKLMYQVRAENIKQAMNFAIVLRDTVRAMHDIWVSEIVCIREITP